MILPCIDLMDGKVVQLVQGRDKALEGDAPLEMLRKFAVFPQIQVIDLDAAMGRGSNDDLVRLLVGAGFGQHIPECLLRENLLKTDDVGIQPVDLLRNPAGLGLIFRLLGGVPFRRPCFDLRLCRGYRFQPILPPRQLRRDVHPFRY